MDDSAEGEGGDMTNIGINDVNAIAARFYAERARRGASPEACAKHYPCTEYLNGYIAGLRVEDKKFDFNDRITHLHTELVNLTNDALASNCPLALVDRLMDAEQVLDVVADFIKGGPRVAR